jgi:hypothetical protein
MPPLATQTAGFGMAWADTAMDTHLTTAGHGCSLQVDKLDVGMMSLDSC